VLKPDVDCWLLLSKFEFEVWESKILRFLFLEVEIQSQQKARNPRQ
jgi:hypothetical protein